MRCCFTKITLSALLVLLLWNQVAAAQHVCEHGAHESIEACEVFHQVEHLCALPTTLLAIPFLTPLGKKVNSSTQLVCLTGLNGQFARAPPLAS